MGSKVAVATSSDEVISVEEAWSKIDRGALLLDCRSVSECEAGILPGAINIPHSETENRLSELGDDKGREVVVYCAVGGRASIVKQILSKEGFLHVFNAGGYGTLCSYGKEKGLLD